MTFLKTASGDLINAACVSRIEERFTKTPSGEISSRRTIAHIDGDERELLHDLGEIERLMLMHKVVPAASGHTVLSYFIHWFSDGKPFVMRQPVLAWRTVGSNVAEPVILVGVSGKPNCIGTAVLFPDGGVFEIGHTVHENEAAWIAAMKKRARDQNAEAEAKHQIGPS